MIENEILNELIKRYPSLEVCKESIYSAYLILEECFSSSHKLLVAGNGGSAADCEHIAGELLKSFELKRKLSEKMYKKLKDLYGDEGTFIADNLQQAVKAIPLTSFCAYNTAFLNDCNEKMMFAQLVNALGIMMLIYIGMNLVDYGIHLYLNLRKEIKGSRKD